MVEGRLNLELGIEGSRAGTTLAEHSREVAKGCPWGSRGCTRPSAWRFWMSRLQRMNPPHFPDVHPQGQPELHLRVKKNVVVEAQADSDNLLGGGW